MIDTVGQDSDMGGDLSRRLSADTYGKVLTQYRQCFEAGCLEAKKKLHGPLSPEEFEINTAIAECTTLSVEVIQSVWDTLHS